jgi:hypothetical protein
MPRIDPVGTGFRELSRSDIAEQDRLSDRREASARFCSGFDDSGNFDSEACFVDIGRWRRAGEVIFAGLIACGRDVAPSLTGSVGEHCSGRR